MIGQLGPPAPSEGAPSSSSSAQPQCCCCSVHVRCMLQGAEMRRGGWRELKRFCRVVRACRNYRSIGVLAQVYPIAAVREALASCGREPSAARPACRGDGVLRRGAGAVPVRVSAGGAALSDGGSAVAVVGRGAAGVGEVMDFAWEDALGVSAVRGAARCPAGAGGGLGNVRGVVSRAALEAVELPRGFGRDGSASAPANTLPTEDAVK